MSETVADLSNLDVTESPIPDSPETDLDGGIACSVCGVDITHLYSGRGRKPTKCEEHKRQGASKIGSSSRVSGDVGAAVQSLESAYTLLKLGLVLVGAHQAAADLTASIPGLSAQNAAYLATDKDLVKRINRVGKVGGRAQFFLTQGLVIIPVAITAGGELRARALENRVPVDEDAPPFADFAVDEEA